MKLWIKDIIFTDRTKDDKPLIDKNQNSFFMLHIEISNEWVKQKVQPNEHWVWISKYYSDDKDKDMLIEKIKVWEIYNIEYKQSWQWKNLISLRDKDWNIII